MLIMKNLFLLLLLNLCFQGFSQNYNNEWIDYTKTYYKFKVSNKSLHRINQPALLAAGLASVPAQNFQLFRNGVQVPIYTSVASGTLGASDFIEFWGIPNDGLSDTALYNVKANQLNKKWSLINDTASYFLTNNTNTGQNLRLTNTSNNVAGNSLPLETSFIYTVGSYNKSQINPGLANVVGEHLFVSAYDKGEGWASTNIQPGTPFSVSFTNLYPALSSSYVPKYNVSASGNEMNTRTFSTTLNGTSVFSQAMDYFEGMEYTTSFPLSLLNSGSANLMTSNNSGMSADRMVLGYQEIKYPRLFNFGGATSFEFELDPNAAGNYLEITNFNAGASTPVLYDLTNNKRYTAVVASGIYKFALLPSAVKRSLVLTNQDAANRTDITGLSSRNFINYMAPAYQGNYLILTSTQIHNAGDAANAVEKYKTYRNSAAGGGYNVRVTDVENLYDQYAYGIDKHPMALKNYLKQAKNLFTVAPKFVLIIGRGTAYNDARFNQNEPYMNQLNMVPTFGYPASDNLLTAADGASVQSIPIGRLGAINTTEVDAYLDKLKQFELKQSDLNFTIDNKAWMKNATYVVGSSDPFLQGILDNYQLDYMRLWTDTLIGGKGNLFTKSTINGVAPLSNSFMESLWNKGQSIVEYFGHSSATALEYNLDDPYVYNNPGKYPVMLINGCNAGNYFIYNPYRVSTNNNQSLSEKFIFAPNKGSIGYVASTHFGVVNYLHFYNYNFFKNSSVTNYGATLGEIMKNSTLDMFNITGNSDFYARMLGEQTLLQGDPALHINVKYPKPDFVVEDQTVSINPSVVSVADSSFTAKMFYMNLGNAVNDSITIKVQRQFPDGKTKTIYNTRVKSTKYLDSLNFGFKINPIKDKGINRITITVDSDNLIDEMSETNNSVTKQFTIIENDILPVYPFNFGIVSAMPLKLKASTANPLAISRSYQMELDTTELFNSPLKTTQTVVQNGGFIEYAPVSGLINNKVYYWRVASTSAVPQNWRVFSFTYLSGSTFGFNQGHFYQHLKSGFNRMRIDSVSRKMVFDSINENISVRNGIWPSAAYEEGHLTIAVNQDAYIRSFCAGDRIGINVFDPISGKPWLNTTVAGVGMFNSQPADCLPGRQWNFEYDYTSLADRNKANAMLINNIPNGHYVIVRNITFEWTDPSVLVNTWKLDAAANGNGQSLYNTLISAGFTKLDSFYDQKSWIFAFRKGTTSFVPQQLVSENNLDRISLATTFTTTDTLGYTISPAFGPAKEWKEVHWRGNTVDPGAGDQPSVDVIGVNYSGTETNLLTLNASQIDYNIQSISATQYPYLKLRMLNKDASNATPWQLDYWRLNYTPAPEGAMAPNIDFLLKDTFNINEPIQFRVAFKNISDANFADSVTLKVTLIDSNDVVTTIQLPKQKALIIGDTILVNQSIPSFAYRGTYGIFVELNADFAQPEQNHFNNILYKNIYVRYTAATLPANGLQVNARLVNNQLQTLVNWSTASESNTSRFVVEHSINGVQFNPVGDVIAAGNSSSVTNYTFNHPNPVNGINFYRIKQVDRDGNYKYSIIVSVFKKDNVKQTLIAPNPVQQILQILEPAQRKVNTIDVFDSKGVQVMHFYINEKNNFYRLPVQNLATGNYVLKMNYENESVSIPFMKQ
jgi:hypothetical protein